MSFSLSRLWQVLIGADVEIQESAWARRQILTSCCEDGSRLKFKTAQQDRADAELRAHQKFVDARKTSSPLPFRRRA